MIETARTTRAKERRKTLIALIVSIGIHLLLLLFAMVVISLDPDAFFPPEPEEDEPLELTILPPEPEETEEPGFFDSSQGELAEKPPEDAKFESDQDTRAASEAPAVDESAMPSVEGEDELALTLRNQDATVGPIQPPQPATPPSPLTAAQPEQPAKPSEAEPQPKEPVEAEESAEAEVKPEATPEPTPTPPPEPAELALLDPTPRKPVRKPEPEVRKPEQPRPPSPERPPGYQPQTRTTRLTGGISNRGRASVEAMATPLGRYKKMLSDAIGSRWYYYVNDMLDLVSIGTVELRFIVRADGTVEGVRVLSNSSNESLASCSVRSIVEAEIPPIPPEIVAELEGGRIEVDYSFTIIGR